MLKHALVVDDDPVIRNLFAALLRRKGIAAAQAADGQEAITLLKSSADGSSRGSGFDLILLDLMMPRASGWAVLDYLAVESPDSLNHLIVISATADQAAGELRRRGCSTILNKPFEAEIFYEAVARNIRGPFPVGGGGSPGTSGWGTPLFS